jgi:hypothetical protein
MSWDSLRDVAAILRTASLTGTVASLAGGLAGAVAASPTRRASSARR